MSTGVSTMPVAVPSDLRLTAPRARGVPARLRGHEQRGGGGLQRDARGRTCRPAMGFSFAAGTTDGPSWPVPCSFSGLFYLIAPGSPLNAECFKRGRGGQQGLRMLTWAVSRRREGMHWTPVLALHAQAQARLTSSRGTRMGTLFWRVVRHFLKEPAPEQVACQAPKPILLDTGSVHVPYEWCAAAHHRAQGPGHAPAVVENTFSLSRLLPCWLCKPILNSKGDLALPEKLGVFAALLLCWPLDIQHISTGCSRWCMDGVRATQCITRGMQ